MKQSFSLRGACLLAALLLSAPYLSAPLRADPGSQLHPLQPERKPLEIGIQMVGQEPDEEGEESSEGFTTEQGEYFDGQIFLPEALIFLADGDPAKRQAVDLLQDGELDVFFSPGAWRGYAQALAPDLLEKYPRSASPTGHPGESSVGDDFDPQLVKESLETAPVKEVAKALYLLAPDLARLESEVPEVEAAGESFLLLVEDEACRRDLTRLEVLTRETPPPSADDLEAYQGLEPGERELMVLGNYYDETHPEGDEPVDPRTFGDASEPVPDGFCPAQLGDEPTPEYRFDPERAPKGPAWSCPLHGTLADFRWRQEETLRERFRSQAAKNSLMRSMLRKR